MRVDTRLSARLKKINPSPTLTITSLAKRLKQEGKDIVNFAAGEPDFDTPDFIKVAAINAIKSGFTKYTPSTGIPELKKLISEKFAKDNGLNYSIEQIVVSCGAKHSLFNVIFALVNPQEEILIPVPYWVSYPEMVHLCDGSPRFIKTLPEDDFKLTAKELHRNISPKTKALILNSPSNPTGCVYTQAELKEIAELCAEKKIYVISDEIYEKLIYDNKKHISIAGLNQEIFDLTITVNGLSKSYSMTGWRIGYIGAPLNIVEAISKIQDHTTSNPASISQKAAVAALSANHDFTIEIRSEFEKRRNLCITRLKEIKKLKFVVPEGAFYIFCDISKTGIGSETFAQRLLNETFVSLIPGKGFGMDQYIRISFATGIEQIQKGMDRLADWIKKI